MRVLVLGGTYFVGKALIKKLLENGNYNITVLNRGTREHEVNSSISFIKADRKNSAEMKSVLRGKVFDAVFDISGYDAEDIEIAVNTLKNNVNHYIFCSSVAVYKQPPQYWPLTEEHMKCLSLADDRYGFNKQQAENILCRKQAKEQMNITIIRPTYIYGPYDYYKRELLIFERALAGLPVMVSGDGENIVQLGYVYDLADAMIKIANNEKAYGEAFNVCGKEFLTVNNFIRLAAEAVGKNIDIIYKDANSSDEKIDGFARLPSVHRFADISKVEKMLGIIPRTTLEDGLKITAKWWLNNQRG